MENASPMTNVQPSLTVTQMIVSHLKCIDKKNDLMHINSKMIIVLKSALIKKTLFNTINFHMKLHLFQLSSVAN